MTTQDSTGPEQGQEIPQKTAEEIYEANRPRFHDWGTLKQMCLASMRQYADQELAAYKLSEKKDGPVLSREDVQSVKIKLEGDKADYLERAEAEGTSKNDDFDAGFMACFRRMNGMLNVKGKQTPSPESSNHDPLFKK